MNTLDAIAGRRSIRRFKPDELDRLTIEKLLTAAIQAPSGKNRQPWHWIVLTGEGRTHLADLIDQSCEAIRVEGGQTGSAPASAAVIRQAPVTIMAFETEIPPDWKAFEEGARLVDAQSIGAAIQNICLAATDLGLGSLWIGDVLYAESAITQWLGERGERMIAAISIGLPDESPETRSRKPLAEVVEWKDDPSWLGVRRAQG